MAVIYGIDTQANSDYYLVFVGGVNNWEEALMRLAISDELSEIADAVGSYFAKSVLSQVQVSNTPISGDNCCSGLTAQIPVFDDTSERCMKLLADIGLIYGCYYNWDELMGNPESSEYATNPEEYVKNRLTYLTFNRVKYVEVDGEMAWLEVDSDDNVLEDESDYNIEFYNELIIREGAQEQTGYMMMARYMGEILLEN